MSDGISRRLKICKSTTIFVSATLKKWMTAKGRASVNRTRCYAYVYKY